MSEWIDVKDALPTKAVQVLLDGNEYFTYMVGIFDPSDSEFPWTIHIGHDIHNYNLDAFQRWKYLIEPPTGDTHD